MWDNLLIILIVAACALFIGRRFWRQLSGKGSGCGCNCESCQDKTDQNENCKANADFPRKNDA